jgi:hypothetical protein
VVITGLAAGFFTAGFLAMGFFIAGFFAAGFFATGLLAGEAAVGDVLEPEGAAGMGILLITFVFGALALGTLGLDATVLGRFAREGLFADMMIS